MCVFVSVEIYPLEPTVHAGQGFTLTCEIAGSNNIVADDIKWSHNGVTLPAELYSALDPKRSQLSIQEASFQDSGLYACNTETSSQGVSNSTQVNVGGVYIYILVWDESCFFFLGGGGGVWRLVLIHSNLQAKWLTVNVDH